eukprot:365681-Chlamydomonas_euryale.AAC.9
MSSVSKSGAFLMVPRPKSCAPRGAASMSVRLRRAFAACIASGLAQCACHDQALCQHKKPGVVPAQKARPLPAAGLPGL